METHFTFLAAGLTDTGLRRNNNEDGLLVHSESGCFLVADGMGGAAAGEIASRMFIDTASLTIPFQKHRTKEEAASLIKNTFLTANTRIRTHTLENPDHEGMGCTAELLLTHDSGFVLGHIGDSRTYRLRGHNLSRLTRDHSLIQNQIDEGLISREEARTHRLRNVIVRAVGVDDQLEVDIIRGSFSHGDILLLCSDGLTDMVNDEEIKLILNADNSPKELAGKLIDQANQAGGRDNITVVLVKVGK